jgi:hypothetical protein
MWSLPTRNDLTQHGGRYFPDGVVSTKWSNESVCPVSSVIAAFLVMSKIIHFYQTHPAEQNRTVPTCYSFCIELHIINIIHSLSLFGKKLLATVLLIVRAVWSLPVIFCPTTEKEEVERSPPHPYQGTNCRHGASWRW